MAMEVLQNKAQIERSRKVLRKMGASSLETGLRSFMRRLGLVRGVSLGDYVKSWDVLETLKFLNRSVEKDEPILDIGSYASEIIVALHKSGYTRLTGADLNPDLKTMPYNNAIRYEIADFMNTRFEDVSFKAITAISVIEHGFNGTALLKEMSRLLRPEGYFIASFDYWPEKIDTTGVQFFGMDWKIFSREDVAAFIEQAAGFGLVPVGKLQYDDQEAPIECGGKKYTFAWLVLQKKV